MSKNPNYLICLTYCSLICMSNYLQTIKVMFICIGGCILIVLLYLANDDGSKAEPCFSFSLLQLSLLSVCKSTALSLSSLIFLSHHFCLLLNKLTNQLTQMKITNYSNCPCNKVQPSSCPDFSSSSWSCNFHICI